MTSTKKSDPPLLNIQVTNPIIYIKSWWKKVMANEGIDLRFRVKPLTAIAITVIAFSFWFGLGGVVLPYALPFLKYTNAEGIQTPIIKTPTPTPNPWKETALTGTLRQTTNTSKYYLVTRSTEAVTLEFIQSIDLTKYIGKRILASGMYNSTIHVLKVTDITDMEVLPTKAVTIPTPTPTNTPTPTQTPTFIPTTSPEG